MLRHPTRTLGLITTALSACIPDWPLPGLGDTSSGSSPGHGSSTDDPAPTEGPIATTDPTSTGEANTTTLDTTSTISSTTDASDPPPTLGPHGITPDYTTVNALLIVDAAAQHSDGVRMQIGDDAPIELVQVSPGQFAGQIAAFTGLDNDHYTAALTPWRGAIDGETALVDYVIALPPPSEQLYWQPGSLAANGYVAAVDVLLDGRPVEFGTFQDNGTPRCFLRLRAQDGTPVQLLPVLPTTHCQATDLTIDRETGVIHVLLDRKGGDGELWWVGEISAWGLDPVNIGMGTVDETALALARHPDMIAVCGAKQVASPDNLDAFATLLRPNEQAPPRLFDYVSEDNLHLPHWFAETARDCKFAGDALVLVGEAWGRHEVDLVDRDRLAVIEYDLAADKDYWVVAGPGPGVQSRVLALDVDDAGNYHLAGYTCADDCKPDGEVRVYKPGGVLTSQVQLGPLGSPLLGPHDIAWSPAGYDVVALGALQGQDFVFKVQAVAPGNPVPLWIFTPKNAQGQQLALTVAVGPYGEIYAGGIADDHPAFAVIGG